MLQAARHGGRRRIGRPAQVVGRTGRIPPERGDERTADQPVVDHRAAADGEAGPALGDLQRLLDPFELRSLSVFVDADWPCAARSPQQLLARETAQLRLAPDDFTMLAGGPDGEPRRWRPASSSLPSTSPR